MTKTNLPEPLPESTWRRVSDAVAQMQREEHAAIDRLHDELRQVLQTIALEEAMPPEVE